MGFCGKIGGIRSFLTSSAKLFNISKTRDTLTGQPIEELVFVKNIRVFFEPKTSDEHRLFPAGQVKIGQFTALSLEAVTDQQVLEIKNIRYRVIADNDIKYKETTFYFQLHLDFYKHAQNS